MNITHVTVHGPCPTCRGTGRRKDDTCQPGEVKDCVMCDGRKLRAHTIPLQQLADLLAPLIIPASLQDLP